MGTIRYEIDRRINDLRIPTPSTTRGDAGFGMVDGSIGDVIRAFDIKTRGNYPIFEKFETAIADLTTATRTDPLFGAIWQGAVDNAGTAAVTPGLLTLTCAAASGDGAAALAFKQFYAERGVTGWPETGNPIVFEAIVKIANTDVSTVDAFMGLAGLSAAAVNDTVVDKTNDTVERIGFVVVTGAKTILALADDGADGDAVNALAGSTLNVERVFTIVYTPGVSAKFYINGVLTNTVTANLPNGGTALRPYFYIETNAAVASAMTVKACNVYYL